MRRPDKAKKESKITAACREISALAHRLGPNAKLPTVVELREQLGVSVATLNEALHEAEARQLISRKHGVGIYVSSRLPKSVALVCAPRFFRDERSPFWDLLVSHSEKRAALKNEEFSFHFASPDNDESGLHDGLRRAIANRAVQGVIAVGLDIGATRWLEAQNVPVVVYAGAGRYTVTFDEVAGISGATNALISQGCQRLELWSSAPEPQESANAIYAGNTEVQVFTRVSQNAGLPDNSVRWAGNEAGTLQEQGFALAHRVFGAPANAHPNGVAAANGHAAALRPDGIVFWHDLLAHGALIGLQKLGVRVGTDVQIATHANVGSPVLLGHDHITLLENDPEELVAATFNLLEGLMSGDLSLAGQMHVFIPPHLRRVD